MLQKVAKLNMSKFIAKKIGCKFTIIYFYTNRLINQYEINL